MRKSCKGCECLTMEDAGRGRCFYICNASPFERSKRRVLDSVPKGVEYALTLPAWCRKERSDHAR